MVATERRRRRPAFFGAVLARLGAVVLAGGVLFGGGPVGALAEEAPPPVVVVGGGGNATNGTNVTEPAHPVFNLTDADFDRETQVMIGMAAGDWLVAFCLPASVEPCPWEALTELATTLRDEFEAKSEDADPRTPPPPGGSPPPPSSPRTRVATVDADENLRLALRFHVATANRVAFFSRGRMHDYDGALTADALRAFIDDADETRGEGAKIPRKAGPLKPVHDALGDFFDVVDYRAMCIALCVLAMALVVVGAFTPHDEPNDDESADKDDAASTKKKN